MISSNVHSKIRAAFSASAIAVSLSLSATCAFGAPEAETKVLAPSSAASKAADAKAIAVKKTKPNDKNINAKKIKLTAPKGANGTNAVPVNPGGPGPIPPKDELKPIGKVKTPLASTANGKQTLKTSPANDVKTGIDKSIPSAPAKQ
jgi:hypothetical protein